MEDIPTEIDFSLIFGPLHRLTGLRAFAPLFSPFLKHWNNMFRYIEAVRLLFFDLNLAEGNQNVDTTDGRARHWIRT
jgi:hypothetical protein